jgi:hypothetical protein
MKESVRCRNKLRYAQRVLTNISSRRRIRLWQQSTDSGQQPEMAPAMFSGYFLPVLLLQFSPMTAQSQLLASILLHLFFVGAIVFLPTFAFSLVVLLSLTLGCAASGWFTETRIDFADRADFLCPTKFIVTTQVSMIGQNILQLTDSINRLSHFVSRLELSEFLHSS